MRRKHAEKQGRKEGREKKASFARNRLKTEGKEETGRKHKEG
jgi:hypothetical protein